MSLRTFDLIHESLESVMKRAPRRGATATYAISILSRIEWVIRQCRTLIARAQCLSKARSECTSMKEYRVCDTKCSSLMVLEAPGEIVVYRKSRNPIAVKAAGEGLEITTKNNKIKLGGTILKLETQTTTGKTEKIIRLDNIEEVYDNDYIIKEALKGLEITMVNLLKNLAACTRATATPCP